MMACALGSGLNLCNKLRGTDRTPKCNQGLTPDMTTKSSMSPRLTNDLSDIATPALLIDLPTVERNIREMADYVRSHGLDLRPHIKTHKSLSVARLQVQAGAKGLTVAKVGEAEVMSEVSDDLLVAYPLVDRARVQRIAS